VKPPLRGGTWASLPPLDQIRPEHTRYVRSVVARLGFRPTYYREDIVQEVLYQAHRSRGSRLEVRPLLFGIARHVVSAWRERQTRLLDLDHHWYTTTMGTFPSVEDEQREDEHERARRDAVHAAIAEIPEPWRYVFVRTQIDGVPVPALAAELGVNKNTIHTRLHKARAVFLAALQRLLARRRGGQVDL
jgi:RNA polymerase sigma factor (sigma-70 family)